MCGTPTLTAASAKRCAASPIRISSFTLVFTNSIISSRSVILSLPPAINTRGEVKDSKALIVESVLVALESL